VCAVQGDAGILLEVLHTVQVYTTLCSREEDPENNRNDKIAAKANTIDEKPTLHVNNGRGSGNEDDITCFTQCAFY
jgi:hypothetical protein